MFTSGSGFSGPHIWPCFGPCVVQILPSFGGLYTWWIAGRSLACFVPGCCCQGQPTIQHSLFSKGRLVQRHVQRHSTACVQTCADPTLDGVAVWLLLVRSLLLNCLQAVPSAAACCTQRNVPPRCGMGSKLVASIARSSRCVASSTDALKVHTVLHRRQESAWQGLITHMAALCAGAFDTAV